MYAWVKDLELGVHVMLEYHDVPTDFYWMSAL